MNWEMRLTFKEKLLAKSFEPYPIRQFSEMLAKAIESWLFYEVEPIASTWPTVTCTGFLSQPQAW